VAAVMDSMGHASVQTAMIYQHQGLEQLRTAINGRNRDNRRLQRTHARAVEFCLVKILVKAPEVVQWWKA
jgi:hypothetical protein